MLLVLLLFLAFACSSGPQGTETVTVEDTSSPVAEPEAVKSPPAAETVFNPVVVTPERYATTLAELRSLIENLNTIIRNRDFYTWVTYLSPAFYTEMSSPEFLAEKTEELFRRDQMIASGTGRDPRLVQKREMRTVRDYFLNVVVPARSNDQLDEIVFVSENQVIAYTLDNRGNRLILYNLEITDGGWKIVN